MTPIAIPIDFNVGGNSLKKSDQRRGRGVSQGDRPLAGPRAGGLGMTKTEQPLLIG